VFHVQSVEMKSIAQYEEPTKSLYCRAASSWSWPTTALPLLFQFQTRCLLEPLANTIFPTLNGFYQTTKATVYRPPIGDTVIPLNNAHFPYTRFF
jgi:hypothetical protein